jgi:exonuclease SbcD
VLLVEAEPGVPAQVESRALTTPWRLRTVRGTVDELRAAAETVGDAWLRVVVREPTRAGLADDVRAILPRAVDIRVEHEVETIDAERTVRRGRTPRELFVEYLAEAGIEDNRVVHLFEQLYDDAMAEASG